MTSKNFTILRKGKRLGPFTLGQVKAMRARGDCDSLTRIASTANPDSWHPLDAFLKQLENEAVQPTVAEPPPLTRSIMNRDAVISIVKPFPIFPLLLLHFLTAGIFSFFWLLSRHSVLPNLRADDPSTSKAIGLCFVPFYNLYWFVVVFVRLTDRGNQFARSLNSPKKVPRAMAFVVAALYLIPIGLAMIGALVWASIMFSPDPPELETSLLFFILPQIFSAINFLLALPIFSAQIQTLLNSCFDRQVAGLLQNHD